MDRTQRQSDQGYASLSDNLSSPYVGEAESVRGGNLFPGDCGSPYPTTLLTEVEQNALRDVRRKLKSKHASMENWRRKKEYVSDLEITQVADFRKQVSPLE